MKRWMLLSVALLVCCVVRSASAASYCTGAATCTATTPGSCERICEDFEGAALCATGYDSVCRNTWSFIKSTGQSMNFKATQSGTFSCTDKGSYALELGSTQASYSDNINYDFGSDYAILYGEFYVNIKALTVADGYYQTLAAIDSGANTANTMGISVKRTGSNYILSMACDGCSGLYNGSTNLMIDGSTWYRIGWKADTTNKVAVVYLNGTQEIINSSDYTTTKIPRVVVHGWNSYLYRQATAATIQYENIAVSSTAQPGGCNTGGGAGPLGSRARWLGSRSR